MTTPVVGRRRSSACPKVRTIHRARRIPVLLAASVMAALLAPLPGAPPAAAATGSPVVFGAVGATVSEIQSHERVLGKKMQGVRVFKNWDSKLFGEAQQYAKSRGQTLFLSIKAKRDNGSMMSFRDIANARPGSHLHNEMLDHARQIKSFGAPVFIIFNHEPEASTSVRSGGGADFANAWRKVISTYRAAGVRNAEYVWTMTGYGFTRTDSRNARNYYPGDSYVDHIAADVYNWYRCGGTGWVSMATLLEGHRRFGLQHPGKGLMIMEWGASEDPARPGRKAQWINEARDLFKKPAYSQYRAVMQWGGRTHNGDNSCSFDYTTSSSARDAWRGMGVDVEYAGTWATAAS